LGARGRALGNDKKQNNILKHLLTIIVLNKNQQANKICFQIKVKLQLKKESRSVVKIVNKQIEANGEYKKHTLNSFTLHREINRMKLK
jgi:hypothetical protein